MVSPSCIVGDARSPRLTAGGVSVSGGFLNDQFIAVAADIEAKPIGAAPVVARDNRVTATFGLVDDGLNQEEGPVEMRVLNVQMDSTGNRPSIDPTLATSFRIAGGFTAGCALRRLTGRVSGRDGGALRGASAPRYGQL